MEAGVLLVLVVRVNKENNGSEESEGDADDEDDDVSPLITDENEVSVWFYEEKSFPVATSFLPFLVGRDGRMFGVFLEGDGVALLGTRKLVEFIGRRTVCNSHWCALMRLPHLLWVSVIITWCYIEPAIAVGYLPDMMVRMGEERGTNSSLLLSLRGMPLVLFGSVTLSQGSSGQYHQPVSEVKFQIGRAMQVVARLLGAVQDLNSGSWECEIPEPVTLLADRGMESFPIWPAVGGIFVSLILLSRVEKLFKISSM